MQNYFENTPCTRKHGGQKVDKGIRLDTGKLLEYRRLLEVDFLTPGTNGFL